MMAANDIHALEAVFVPGADNHRAFRNALGSFTTGVTVVTATTSDGPIGMTVNSFASVSLDPPLVLWSPAKSSSRYGAFTGARHFAIHVLGADQDHLSAAFTRGGNGFDGIEVRFNDEGVPVLPGTLARFECAEQAQHDAGDHTIIIGRVLRVAHRQGEPLCFSGGRFGRFAV
ncbi:MULTISPECIES: flavin reductase family protein [Rhizobiaceae]|jgi:flavin reductase (DIM6/NTAB) family NADH-FMN oxidoreductase RutF|uniref:Flavin reductase (DIM6/NTAB) family NADH-FMN oxidoreductase RutF n=1 Tax=Peteryoungia aggregata LMG 23059 TaxID=1368425 RepID=A0ABU0G296_9HYPH|nr:MULTISPECIES: flavin reductase family protein [Rhizobiaceae]MDM7980967.1 flavin reductase family protein [Rhizobium sp.]AOG09614.1 flavin reductase like domain protein [Agrobacterium sp. RAC06]MDM8012391.1 flavin reductase family protein [Rhizobium sp.]MDQ0419449.1 flavin reductase (DIM6/NTAB) family NADH-FMN oxidoreductase RutF [Peteryoungia aggregata LMG 23059]MDZ7873945.1 flavin reductase family protein [Rhizobium sp.]